MWQKLLAVGLFLAVILLYWPGLSGAFIFDDFHNFVENPAVHVDEWSLEAVEDAATAYGSGLPHRPIATLSLAVDHYFWGEDAFGFKLTNVLIHALNASLVLLLLLKLQGEVNRQFHQFWPPWSAFVLAAVWAFHPLQVSTVLYVVQRMEMLAVMLILLSLIGYLQGRRHMIGGSGKAAGWFALAMICTILAILSKEIGVLAPLLMLAMELVVFRFSCSTEQSARRLKAFFVSLVGFYLLVFLVWVLPQQVDPARWAHREFTQYERLLTQLRVLPMYIYWVLVPAPDHYLFYYDQFSHSKGLLRPVTTLLGGIFLASLGVVAWLVRNRSPMVALGIAWFFVAHILTSNVFSLELVFEHRNYFAVLGGLLAVAGLLQMIAASLNRRIVAVAAAALVLGLGAITATQTATWGNQMNLALALVERNPDSERAGLDLGELYLDYSDGYSTSPFFESAMRQFERVAVVDGASIVPDQALVLMKLDSGRATPPDLWDRLIGKLRDQALRSRDFDVVLNLLRQRRDGAELDDAKLDAMCRTLVERRFVPAPVLVQVGYFSVQVLDDVELAGLAFRQAADAISDDREALERLRGSLADEGVLHLLEG